MVMDIHRSMIWFRLASRELFNHYFAVPSDPQREDFTYEYYEGFDEVEQTLFEKLVIKPCSVPCLDPGYKYGIDPHPFIRVRLPISNAGEEMTDEPSVGTIMFNREINSGYWDHPLYRFTNEATLLYVCYFDWNSMHSRDNSYVRVQVSEWPSHPEVIGKHALVEAYQVQYVQRNSKT